MSYWKDRQKELNKALEKDEEKLKKRLAKMYKEEEERLKKEIASYYARYGRDNVIEYRKLLEELSDEERKLLIENMEDFADKHPEYKHLMPVRESIYKLDRLEGLKYSVELQQLEIGAKEIAMIREHMEKVGTRSMGAAAEALGFGKSFYFMNKDIMEKFVGVPWSNGKSFSDRIWDNKKKLTSYLNTDMAQAFARGDSYDRIMKDLIERFDNVSRRDAYRLIYTEGTFVHAEASIQPFTEEFTKYKVCTVGDGKVCSICQALEEADPIDIEKRVAGENFPPLHPWCRCTFTIEVEDWDKWIDDYVAKHGQNSVDYAEQLTKRFNEKSEFYTKHDPMRDKVGSARESNPKELAVLKEKIRKMGVEIDESGEEMKYGPSPVAGKPGRLTIDPEASYSAWLHEYKHIVDDEASGWNGMKTLISPEEAIKWEDAAYDVEIDYALSLGYNKVANALRYLKGERRKELRGKKDIRQIK